ncbi:hypothetical protein ACIQKB_03860 [Streptomyces sp. NPDC092046]|uniref:hypothetical protein n=1 Tax=Streptomyces sp. NPDC092046 TaxID=3366009 RepID=UPI003810FF9A
MAYAEKVYKVRNGVKTKQFTWRACYKKPDGSKGTEPGFPTKKTAEEWGAEQESAIRRGTWIDPELQRTKFGTFTKKTWMPAKGKRGGTMDRRWNHLAHIFPKWEHVPLNAINWFEVDAWQQTLPVDDVTKGHVVSLMSSILTGAVDAKHLLVNPLFGRRRTKPAGQAQTSVTPKKKVDGPWTPEQVLLVSERMGPVNGLHLITTAFTGLSWGEGAALHRRNTLLVRREAHDGGEFTCPVVRVDEMEGTLAEYTLRGAEGERLGLVHRLEPPKNDDARPRDVDVAPFLEYLLRLHLEVWPFGQIFCTPSGKLWRRGNFTRAELRPAADGRPELTKTRGRAERPGWDPIAKGMTMRGLRRTHDSYQAEIGVKEPLAYEQAGHSRPGIKAVYQKPTPAMRAERLAGLQELFAEAVVNTGLKTLWGQVEVTPLLTPRS